MISTFVAGIEAFSGSKSPIDAMFRKLLFIVVIFCPTPFWQRKSREKKLHQHPSESLHVDESVSFFEPTSGERVMSQHTRSGASTPLSALAHAALLRRMRE